MNRDRNLVLARLLVIVIAVLVGSIWLARSTETLDKVAERFGAKESPIWNPPLPDYEAPGFEGNTVLNVLIGIVFGLVVFGVTMSIGRVLGAKRKVAE